MSGITPPIPAENPEDKSELERTEIQMLARINNYNLLWRKNKPKVASEEDIRKELGQ